MSSRIRSTILQYGSRLKRAIHRATAPRTPPSHPTPPGPPVPPEQPRDDRLVELLFPDGASAEALDLARTHVADGRPWSPSAVRQILGSVDQHHAPSPVTVRASKADLRYTTVESIELAIDALDASVSQQILSGQPYEPHIERIIRDVLSPGNVFVDVGANIGYHTALASALVGPTGVVYAFEPNPENARLIAHTIERNGLSNVRLKPFALSTSSGYTSFRTAVGSNGGFVTAADPREFDATVTIVPTVRLDRSIDTDDAVDLIKIDVEGAEPFVLAGATELLRGNRPPIIFEFSQEMSSRVAGAGPTDLFKMLIGHGYRISLIERPSGALIPVSDPDKFMSEWGNYFRIEDFLAQPG